MKKFIRHFNTLKVRIIIGMGWVFLPLIYALYIASDQIGELIDFSQKAVQNYGEITLSIAAIHAETNELNRKAQQSIAVPEIFLEMYQQRSKIVRDITSNLLNKIKEYDEFKWLIMQYLEEEEKIYNYLSNKAVKHDNKILLEKTNILEKITLKMLTSDFIMNKTNYEIKHQGTYIIYSLTYKIVLLFFFTALVSFWLVYFINQPFKKMEKAINNLGAGQLDDPIQIKGSSDMARLGQKLEWLRQRLNDLEASKIRFIQHVSHDLKTPLTAVKESINLMRASGFELLNQDRQELVEIAERNIFKLQKLIEDLLNFQNAYTQTIRLELTLQRIDFLIEQVCEQHCLTLRSRQLDLKLDLIVITLLVDKEKFYAIIDNLLSNALKYAPPHSVISMRSWQDDKQFFITIHDDGVGIPKAHRTHVFDPFYQVNSPEQGTIKGSGLGLAIVQYYVHAHQGIIEILDTEHGTTFQISLPLS
jgi:two-component system, NtrC family, sensor histidine kinase GlrK